MVRKMGGALHVKQRVFWVVNWNGVELINQTFELLVVLLRVVILEVNGLCFNLW